MATTDTIGYRSSGLTHAFLKVAMLQHWEGQCPWCGNAIPDTSGFELDHVIAQSQFDQAINDRPEWGINFDVDDLENLAPLCLLRRCNQKKSDSIDGMYIGAIIEVLDRSKKKAEGIRRSVQHMYKARGLEKSVLAVLAADLKDQRAKELFTMYGTNLVGRLYRFDPAIVESATTNWPMWQENRSIINFPCNDGLTVVVDVDLNAAGRAAYQVAQQLEQHGVKLGELLGHAADKIGPRLEKLVGPQADPESLPRIEGHSLAFEIKKGSIQFKMDCEAYRFYTEPSDYGTLERFVVGGPYEIRVKVHLDGTWSTKTRVKGEASVYTEEAWFAEPCDGVGD